MMVRNYNGNKPRVDDTAYIHPSAAIIGNVQIGENVFIGPNTVIRADGSDSTGRITAVVIESDANIQDGVVINALDGSFIRIGKGATLAHGVAIGGPCDVGDACFIGFESAVFKSNLGKGVIIQHQTIVEGVTIEAGMHVPPMNVVLNKEDVLGLKAADGELAAFGNRVRRTSVFVQRCPDLHISAKLAAR